MKMLTSLRAKLKARLDTEHEQALLRIVIVGLVLAYMTLFHAWVNSWSEDDIHIVRVLTGFFGIAVAIFVAVCTDPAPNVSRRILGMVADSVGCTWYLCVAGEYGFFVIAILLFITFGNGFRYGRRYLFICQAMCLVGFTGVLLFVPFWADRRVEGVGLLIALVVLPLYVSTLLKRIQEARARAEEANLAKSTFLANMSHEIRTPLNGIVGVVDLFRTTELSTQQDELVNLLRHSVSVLRSLVDDVLDISKIESGRLTIEVASFDLHSTVNGLVALLRPHAEAKGLELLASVDPEIDYRLRGDHHHLRQVLLNLLTNAVKFTQQGEVNLDISLKRRTKEGMTVRFEVRDSGIGIAENVLPNIFDRFVQADQSTTRQFGGSGLGTTIAKQLVELMGGNIGVHSTLGKGTTFWVELPLLHDEPASMQGDIEEENRPSRTILVGREPQASVVLSKLQSIGESVINVPTSELFGPNIDALIQSGETVRAIVVVGGVDTACACFASATQRLRGNRPALIFVATHPLTVVDSARIKSIRESQIIKLPIDARLLLNAIHAATANTTRGENGKADLTKILQRPRRSLRVLVADDNQTNRAILVQLLTAAGHTVSEANDGEAALDAFEREAPDIGLLDFNMPQRNGLEVISAVRMMEALGQHTPLIILSASVTPEARDRALRAGADDFIGKPFEAAAVLERLDTLASTQRGRSSVLRDSPLTSHSPIPNSVNALEASPSGAPVRMNSANLDVRRLRELEDISRDSEFMKRLIGSFIEDFKDLELRLTNAVSAANTTEIADTLHAMKGAAVGVGAIQLALLCDTSDSSNWGDSAEADSRLAMLRGTLERTLSDLEFYLLSQHIVSF